jgi:hypothetical protein
MLVQFQLPMPMQLVGAVSTAYADALVGAVSTAYEMAHRVIEVNSQPSLINSRKIKPDSEMVT